MTAIDEMGSTCTATPADCAGGADPVSLGAGRVDPAAIKAAALERSAPQPCADAHANGNGHHAEAASEEEEPVGRRGSTTLRQRTMNAIETLEFPPYPQEVTEAQFALPRHLVDNDAPLSARKWDLALSLADKARGLAQRQAQAVEQLVAKRLATSVADDGDSKRTRRPTAIMRQNCEVARLMGVVGTKQKFARPEDLGDEAPQPQHLSTTRGKNGTFAPREDGRALAISTPGSAGPSTPGSAGEERPVRPPRKGEGGPRLPVVATVPLTLADPPVLIHNASVQRVLSAADVPAAGLGMRRVTGAILGADSGKRKRKPPSRLVEQVEFDEADELERKRAAPITTTSGRVVAAPAAAADPAAAAALIIPACRAGERRLGSASVRLIGVVPRGGGHGSGNRGRGSPATGSGSMPPPPPPLLTPTSSDRSPREVGSRKPQRLDSGGRSSTGSAGAASSADDGFYFGDLPSPRVIEVIRPKEVLLPGWRAQKAEPALPNGKARAKPAGAAAHRAANGEARDAADGSSSDESEEEVTTDEAYERRHMRTLERAITAARAVARAIALKEKQKHAPPHAPSDADADGSVTLEEEWRFRPSELAALCAAARMSFDEAGGASSPHVPGSSAGFFGRGGANRGDKRDAGEGGGDAAAASGDGAALGEGSSAAGGDTPNGDTPSGDAAAGGDAEAAGGEGGEEGEEGEAMDVDQGADGGDETESGGHGEGGEGAEEGDETEACEGGDGGGTTTDSAMGDADGGMEGEGEESLGEEESHEGAESPAEVEFNAEGESELSGELYAYGGEGTDEADAEEVDVEEEEDAECEQQEVHSGPGEDGEEDEVVVASAEEGEDGMEPDGDEGEFDFEGDGTQMSGPGSIAGSDDVDAFATADADDTPPQPA